MVGWGLAYAAAKAERIASRAVAVAAINCVPCTIGVARSSIPTKVKASLMDPDGKCDRQAAARRRRDG